MARTMAQAYVDKKRHPYSWTSCLACSCIKELFGLQAGGRTGKQVRSIYRCDTRSQGWLSGMLYLLYLLS